MAHNQVNEVDELLRDLKKVPGFKAYLVLNSDGIVIRWDQVAGQQMSYQSAVQHGVCNVDYVFAVVELSSLLDILN